jgi:predicted PurR-regulated permease PerM
LEVKYDKLVVGNVFFGVFIILGFLLLIYLIKPILTALSLTLVLAYFFHPIVEFVQPHIRRRWLAIIITFFFILIPVFIFSVVLSTTILSQIIELSKTPRMAEILDVLGENFKRYFEPGLEEPLPTLSISTFKTLREVFTQGAGYIVTFFKVLSGFFLQTLLGIFLTGYLLLKQDKLLALYSSINNDKIRRFLSFVDEALKQIVYSMFLTALFTGIVATIIYVIFGVPFAVLWGTTTGLVSLVPILGTWLVYLPISVYFFLQGETLIALVFLAICIFFITTLPDIAIRPIIASKTIDIGLVIVGLITGTLAFGPVGIIIGPLIIIAWVGFIKIFLIEETTKPEKKG